MVFCGAIWWLQLESFRVNVKMATCMMQQSASAQNSTLNMAPDWMTEEHRTGVSNQDVVFNLYTYLVFSGIIRGDPVARRV